MHHPPLSETRQAVASTLSGNPCIAEWSPAAAQPPDDASSPGALRSARGSRLVLPRARRDERARTRRGDRLGGCRGCSVRRRQTATVESELATRLRLLAEPAPSDV